MSQRTLVFAMICIAFLLACMSLSAQAQTTNTTAIVPQIRYIRDYVPLSCANPVKANSIVTFHYAAHLVKNGRVDELFDETADYAPLTLHVNARAMLPPLATGMIGCCRDERRTIVIPYQFATFESLPKETDLVFLVHVIEIKDEEDIFDIIDADSSGCITVAEFTKYVETSGRVQQDLYEVTGKRLMRIHDANKDGVVECEELPGYNNCDIVTSCKEKRDAFDSFFDSFNTEHHITAEDLIY